MGEKRYDIIFRGRLVADAAESVVKQRLAKLFKSSPAQIDRLFAGGRVVIKKGLLREQADTYREALRKAGAVVSIVSAKSAEATAVAATSAPEEPVLPIRSDQPGNEAPAAPVPAAEPASPANRASFAVDDPTEVQPNFQVKEDPNAGRANFVVDGEDTAPTETESVPSRATEAQTTVAEDPATDDGFGLAAAGSQIVEHETVPAAQIDTDHLESAQIDAPLDVTQRPEAPAIETDHLTAAETDQALDQRERREAPVIDVSHLSAERTLDRLDTSVQPPAPEIDVEHLSTGSSEGALDDTAKPDSRDIDTSHLSLSE